MYDFFATGDIVARTGGSDAFTNLTGIAKGTAVRVARGGSNLRLETLSGVPINSYWSARCFTPAEAPRATAQATPAPGKFWTIAVLKNGKPAPAEDPKVFNTRAAADTGARIMAEEHRGETFVTMEAVAASAIPVHLATTVNL